MQPKPEFLNPDDFPEPHMEPVKVSEAERLAQWLEAEQQGIDLGAEGLWAASSSTRAQAAAELRRLAEVELERNDYLQRLNNLHVNAQQCRAELRRLAAEVAEWERLRDPAVLHAALMRGEPARLTPEQVWHLAADDRVRLGDLEAEVEALRADAERYRWIRRDITTLADIKRMNDIVTNLCLEDMDAAIDAAKASVA